MSQDVTNLNDVVAMRKAGELFRNWAGTPSSRPANAAAAKQALEAVGVQFASNVNGVEVHYYDDNTMHVALPRGEQVEATFASFATQAGRDQYSLPRPFVNLARKIANGEELTQAELDNFYHFRLGDYALQHCE
ncbi:MAG: hypothetical protein ACPGVA_09975 [Pikeienuella sp.]